MREKRWTLPPKEARQWAAALPVLYRPASRRPHRQVYRRGGARQRQGRASPPNTSISRRGWRRAPPVEGRVGASPPPQAAAAAVCRRVKRAVTRRGAWQCVPPCVPRHARADSGYIPSGRGASNWAAAPPTARARRVLGRRPPAGVSERMTWRPRGATARRHKSRQLPSVLKQSTNAELLPPIPLSMPGLDDSQFP